MKRRKNRAIPACQYELPFPIGGQGLIDDDRIGTRTRCYFAVTEPDFSAASEDVFLDSGRMVLRWLGDRAVNLVVNRSFEPLYAKPARRSGSRSRALASV